VRPAAEVLSDIAAEIAWEGIVAGLDPGLAVAEELEQCCCMSIAAESALAEEPDQRY
jgi:hypothetical protein